jgi:hypothetical protein
MAYRHGRASSDFSRILSPRFTKIDPDGFSTRTHSAVHATSAASHSPGVASLPICPP